MTWAHWPQLAVGILLCGQIGIGVARHGQTDRVNARAYIADAAVVGWLLYMGGFWS